MDEQEFARRSDEALNDLQRRLGPLSDEHDFESDLNAGALTIEFEDPPAKFVVSPNSPVRQIWISAHSRSFKLGWDAIKNTFVLPETGDTLSQVIAGAIEKQLGEKVAL
jgi:iron donor protein CyaY